MRLPNIDEMLAERAGLEAEELEASRQAARNEGLTLAGLLVQQKKVGEEEFHELLSGEFGYKRVDKLAEDRLDYGLVESLPIAYLRKHLFIPLKGDDGASLPLVAVFDPLNLRVQDDLRVLFGARRVEVVLTPSREIISAINRTYGQQETRTDSLMQELNLGEDSTLYSELEEAASADLLDETSDAPIIKLVNHLLSQSIKSKASDIHIEPYQNDLKVRFRLDGVLHEIVALPRRLHAPVVSRIKIMAKLNIAEKRLPQDGRIEIKVGDREVDLRVSSLPTAFGERVVMRLLEKDTRLLSLEELGFAPDHFNEMKRLCALANGIVLVTGPTGSGKTTTLYAALSRINSPDKNILTIEDPVEYQIDGIGQMQVNSKIELTFARGLRAMVRQDPDVILIGEVRDLETAEIAIQAALTGHLVFSTLHTNDAASAITRLIDMGVEPFLVSSSVRSILAQRLVRMLCPACKEPHIPTRQELAEFGLREDAVQRPVYRAKGCKECMETGYRGRTAIYELMRLTEPVQELMLKTSDANRIRQLAVSEGMRTLRDDGVRKVLEGVTSIEEVMRVTFL